MDDQLWSEAHYTILGWIESDSDNVAQGLLQSFLLFDRMVEEEECLNSTESLGEKETATPTVIIPRFYHTDLLNLVVNHWRKSIQSGVLTLSKDSPLAAHTDLYPKQLLQRLYRYNESSSHLQPDFQTFAMVLDAISAMVNVSSSVAAHAILSGVKPNEADDLMVVVDDIMDRMISSTRQIDPSDGTPSSIRPNVVVFSSAMNAWVKSGRSEAPTKVEAFLKELKTLHRQFPGWSDMKPNQVTYATAIDAWAKVGNVEKVEELMQEMHKVSLETGDKTIKPNVMALTGYLVALSKKGRMEEAEDVLKQMEDMNEAGELDGPPTVVSYGAVLDGYARSTETGASHRAETLLHDMLKRYRNGDSTVAPNAVSFNSVIFSHMKTGNIQAAESLLQQMHEEYVREGNVDVRPTLGTYNNVLSGLARSRRRDAGERAERLLEYVKEMKKSGDIDKAPDVVVYNTVLDCWAQSRRVDSPDKSRILLRKMVVEGIRPDVISFNTVIHCMAVAGRLSEAEHMLTEMAQAGVEPNAITFNTILSSYIAAARSKPRGHRKSQGRNEELTERMELFFDGLKRDPSKTLDLVTYNTVLNFYSHSGDVDKASALLDEMLMPNSGIVPDQISLNSVINAWANSGREDAPERAEAIFEQILFQNEHQTQIVPGAVTFNSVMSAWTKTRRPEAGERCQYLFDRMMMEDGAKLQPDKVTFNILIHAWSFSTKEDAPEHAERAYEQMKVLYEDGDAQFRPNVRTFGSLINVWSKSQRPNAGEMAETYLRKIIQNAEQSRDEGEMPRVHEFTATIRAWSNSGDLRAPYKADETLFLLLREIEKGNKYAKPDNRLFGAFLTVLATSGMRNKAQYADRLVQMMIKFNVYPNEYLIELLKRCHSATGTQHCDKKPHVLNEPYGVAPV